MHKLMAQFWLVLRRVLFFACLMMSIGCSNGEVDYCFKVIIKRTDITWLEASDQIDRIMFRVWDGMEAGKHVGYPLLRDGKLYLAGNCRYLDKLVVTLDKEYIVVSATKEEYQSELLRALPKSMREELENGGESVTGENR